MKKFIDDYKPIEIELEDSEGNKAVIKSKKTTLKMIKEIEKLEAENKTVDVATKLLSMVFGGKPEDYERYSIPLLLDVINYWRDQIQNPTKATEG